MAHLNGRLILVNFGVKKVALTCGAHGGTARWSFRPGLAASQSGAALSLVEPQQATTLILRGFWTSTQQHDPPPQPLR